MESLWSEKNANSLVDQYSDLINRDLALCLYATRLVGRDHQLVLHGGGNTSVKTKIKDHLGNKRDGIYVKASGCDMETAEPSHFSSLKLIELRQLRDVKNFSESKLRGFHRSCLIDGTAKDPSIETLLHAFLPHKFIIHCHANAILSLTNQIDSNDRITSLFKDSVTLIPYVKPGLSLAQIAIAGYENNTNVKGLILSNHGLVCFGENPKIVYQNMIHLVSLAEKFVSSHRPKLCKHSGKQEVSMVSSIAPIVRGTYCRASKKYAAKLGSGIVFNHAIARFRTSPQILNYMDGSGLKRYASQGVPTPDHAIFIKNRPIILPFFESTERFCESTEKLFNKYIDQYLSYVDHHADKYVDVAEMVDPLPRVVLVPSIGLFGLGASVREADIVADIAEANVDIISGAEAVGAYHPVDESHIFEVEFWSLERKKLAINSQPLTGQVVVITGGAGTIGREIAIKFAEAGAAVAVLDMYEDRARKVASELPGAGLGLHCDVTDEGSVEEAFENILQVFGGVDMLISNAGAAWQGRIGEVSESVLRKSFELNFFAHQRVAQYAVGIMLRQASGGCLLFNISKQAINPGRDFGPYGLPKAATLFLVRQYALDYGQEGIRSSAVNADRIRSGLLTDEIIQQRATARNISKEEYISGNLLKVEITAQDVARAFLDQALALKTTGDIRTVDGGNMAAILR